MVSAVGFPTTRTPLTPLTPLLLLKTEDRRDMTGCSGKGARPPGRAEEAKPAGCAAAGMAMWHVTKIYRVSGRKTPTVLVYEARASYTKTVGFFLPDTLYKRGLTT